MKLKKITFIFPEPLDQNILYDGKMVKQEEILISNVVGIQDRIKKELTRVLKAVNLLRLYKVDLFKLLVIKIEGMNTSLEYMLRFDRDPEDPCKYVLLYPMDNTALLTLKGLGSKLHILGIKDEDLIVGKVLREKQLIEGFRKFVFVDMHVEPGLVVIKEEEIEAEMVKDDQSKQLPKGEDIRKDDGKSPEGKDGI